MPRTKLDPEWMGIRATHPEWKITDEDIRLASRNINAPKKSVWGRPRDYLIILGFILLIGIITKLIEG